MTVEKLLNSITWIELTHWMAYFAIENEDAEHRRMTEETKNKVRRR